MADKLRKGVAADIIILTSALVAKLADEKLLAPSSIKDVGLVETALAVRARDSKVAVSNADDLRRALLASDEIYVPDTTGVDRRHSCREGAGAARHHR